MVTRFALPSSGSPAVTPNPSALWNTNPSLVRAPLVRSANKTNTAITDESSATYVETSATAGNMIHRQYISEPLPYAQTIGGSGKTFRLVVRGIENDAAADTSLQVHIRVLSNDGATSRGNLYTGQSATLNATAGQLGQEFSATTPTTRVFNNVALNSINAQAGDRLCVEIGHRYHNTSTTSYGASLTFGDATSTADHTFVATETTPLAPWIEFSQDLFQVSTTRSTTWDVTGRVSTTRATSWDVNATVTTSRATTWNTNQTATKTVATSWDTKETISTTRATSWDVRQTTTTTRTTSWDVAAPVTPVTPVTRSTTWNVAATVTATRATTWAVSVSGPTKTVSTTWDVDGRVQVTRATTWDLGGGVLATRNTTWDTNARVFKSRITSWDVDATGQAATSRSTTWDVADPTPPTPIIPVAPASRPAVFVTPPGFLVVVRDVNLRRVGAVNVTALSYTCRFCDVGEWSVSVHADSATANALRSPGAGIMIYGSWNLTTPIFTGPVRQRVTTLSDDGTYTLEAAGPDDMVWLADRLAYQMPGRTAPNQGTPLTGAMPTDKQSGPAETVIKHYVEVNAGASAITGRRNLTVAPVSGSPIGANVTAAARMTGLLDLIQDKASTGGVGFRVKQIGQSLVFDVFTPADRTGTARFSTLLGNLDSFQLTETAPTTSYVVVGGGGVGTARVFPDYYDTDAVALWPGARVERFIDQGGADDPDDLNQAAYEQIVQNGPQTSLALTTRDIPQLRFGRDYFVGDRVRVEPRPGQVIKEVIREVTQTWTAEDGVRTVTQVGSFETTGTDRMIKKLQKLEQKTNAENTVV